MAKSIEDRCLNVCISVIFEFLNKINLRFQNPLVSYVYTTTLNIYEILTILKKYLRRFIDLLTNR